MTPVDAASLLRIFDVFVEPGTGRLWRVQIPWATNTPLATGEEVEAGEVIALADAIVTTYADPAKRSTFRVDILRYLQQEYVGQE